MSYVIRNIIFLFNIIVFLFFPIAVFAETSEDLYLSVSADKNSLDDVKSGENIVFTITVKNTSEEDRLVELNCKQNNWSKEVNISAGSVEDIIMNYTVPDDIKGGSSIEFEFSGECDEKNIIGDGNTYFSFYVAEAEDLRFQVQLEQKETFSVGDTLNFQITVENRGNTDVDSIVIEHSLGDEKVEINSLAPGSEKSVSLKYQIPNSIQLNKVLKDSFSLNADGISEIVRDVTFSVLGETELDISLYITPEVYNIGDMVSAVLSIKNVGSTMCENLSVTNSKEKNWREDIKYLSEGGTTKSEFRFEVLKEENISFYVRDQDGRLLSEKTINVFPSKQKENSSVNIPDVNIPESSELDASIISDTGSGNISSGGGSINLGLNNIDSNLSEEENSTLTQEVEIQKPSINTISNTPESNKVVGDNTTSSVLDSGVTNNEVASADILSSSSKDNTISQEGVDLPKTGNYNFHKIGVFLVLTLGVIFIKFKYLHI